MKAVIFGLTALLVAIPGILPGTAKAESYAVGDLGETSSRRACMSTAQLVLKTYIRNFGGQSVAGNESDSESWSRYGWNLLPGNNDVVITCPIVADHVNAFYAIHSSGNDADANANIVAGRLRDLWKDLY